MFDLGFISFSFFWLVLITFSYYLSGRRVGVCLFFSASTTLYILLPVFFHQETQHLFWTLFLGTLSTVIGFNIGYGHFFFGQDERDATAPYEPLNPLLIIWSSAALGILSLTALLAFKPDFIGMVKTYEGRIAFQGESGPLAFLLNQVVISASVLAIAFWTLGRRGLSAACCVSLIAWALYSNAKMSILTAFAAIFAIMVTNCRFYAKSERRTFLLFLLMPVTLPFMVMYSVYRGAESNDLGYMFSLFTSQIQQVGSDDLSVGDFDGPFQVVVWHIESKNQELLYGETYFTQLKVLLPRYLRRDFMDLTEDFAYIQLGSTVKAGVGFAYSIWAEAYLNFGFAGFFIQAFLAGLLSRFMWNWCVSTFGNNEIPLFFQFVMLAYLQRTYLIGHLKDFIVMGLPLIIVSIAVRPFLVQHEKRKRMLAASLE